MISMELDRFIRIDMNSLDLDWFILDSIVCYSFGSMCAEFIELVAMCVYIEIRLNCIDSYFSY